MLKETTITYKELADRVGDMVLCNDIASKLGDGLELVSDTSTLYYAYYDEDDYNNNIDGIKDEYNTYDEYLCDHEFENMYDVFQYFIISDSSADYLLRCTDQIVYYYDDLDIYIWGITHWGTGWDYVNCTVMEYCYNEND